MSATVEQQPATVGEDVVERAVTAMIEVGLPGPNQKITWQSFNRYDLSILARAALSVAQVVPDKEGGDAI